MPKVRTPGREFCLEVVSKTDVTSLFRDSLIGIHSIYAEKLEQIKDDPSKSLKIFDSDKSSLIQLKKAAVKLHLRLLFAKQDKFIFVSVFQLTGVQIRLLTAINIHAAASTNILQGDPTLKDMHIIDNLRVLSSASLIQLEGNVWKATLKGKNELVLAKPSEENKLAAAK